MLTGGRQLDGRSARSRVCAVRQEQKGTAIYIAGAACEASRVYPFMLDIPFKKHLTSSYETIY